MHEYLKPYIALAWISFALVYCFSFPGTKYTSPEVFSRLEIPYTMNSWQGIDIRDEWNLEDKKYNFISQILERRYVNAHNKNLFFSILNAGNFHNPKVCSHGAGFKVSELNDQEFHLAGRTLKTHALYAQKNTEGFLLIYWICIDKGIVDWTKQKIKELYFSLFNKNRVGFMIRLAIPSTEDTLEDALALAQEFVHDLYRGLTPKDADYIFGSKK